MYEIILFYSNSEKMKLRKSQVGSLLQCQFLKKLLKVKKNKIMENIATGALLINS